MTQEIQQDSLEVTPITTHSNHPIANQLAETFLDSEYFTIPENENWEDTITKVRTHLALLAEAGIAIDRVKDKEKILAVVLSSNFENVFTIALFLDIYEFTFLHEVILELTEQIES